jgi:uroporphyrinogen-III synthase
MRCRRHHCLPLQVLAEQHQQFDWVCITSPQAASVFLEGWALAGRPPVRLAVVGDGTGKVFETAVADGAPQPEFVPSLVS